MVKDNLSRLKINTIVKAFIFAETLLWSAWNIIMPIFSLYIAQLPNGNIEKAASSFSFYLFSRVVFGLASGKYLQGKRNRHKIFITIVGMSLLSMTYFGLTLATDIKHIYFFYIMAGLALGIATPAKNSLFSTSLRKDKATTTWSILDATVFLSMAFASMIGGMIAERFGFDALFYMAAIITLLAIFPYLIYIKYRIKLDSDAGVLTGKYALATARAMKNFNTFLNNKHISRH